MAFLEQGYGVGVDVVVGDVGEDAEDGVEVEAVVADVGSADTAEDAGELGGGVDVFFLLCEELFDGGELLIGDRGKFFGFARGEF